MRPLAQWQMGWRWLGCGWRLYRRAPVQLAAFGMAAGVVVVLASGLPMLGALLLGLFAPLFLGSACLVLDDIVRRGKTTRGPRGRAALRAGARSLLRVFDRESRLIPIMLLAIYSLALVLLAQILMFSARLVVGTDVLGAVVGAPLALGLLVALFASLAYALPLVVLRDEPVGTAVVRSVRAARHHLYALLMLFGLLALPTAAGALSALYSPWAAYAVGIVAGALALPWALAALYCSFRTLFAPDAPVAKPAPARRPAPSSAAR